MPMHPTLQMMADGAKDSDRGALRDGTVAEARAAYELVAAAGGESPALASVDDRVMPGPAGDLALRVYTPMGEGPFPIVVFFHGGGFTIGSLDSHDPVARQLSAQAEAVVVSVDYRLAPEAPFPAAVDDSFAALSWVAANAAELGGDGARIAVCGDSAGGNLAAVACLLARDAGGPAVRFQALIYPTTDARGGYPSIEENADGAFLSADTMRWFQEHYLAGSTESADDWRATPMLATDLAGLPPALVLTAEFDPLRDEGEAYAEALRAAGNEVDVKRYDGMTHMFFQLGGVLDVARDAIAETADALKTALR